MSQEAAPITDDTKPAPKQGQGIRHVVTAENQIKVRAWSAVGVRQELQAAMLGVEVHTLRRHYDDELKTAKTDVIDLIAGGVVQRAINGDNYSANLFLKTQAGWRETPPLGTKDNPLVIEDGRNLALRAAAELRSTLGPQAPADDASSVL